MLRLAILLSASTAVAAPKPVKLIQVKEVTIGESGWVVHGFKFIAATPTLSAKLNQMFVERTRARGWLADGVRWPKSGDINCQIGFATSVLITWHCGGIGLNQGGGGGYKFTDDAELVIDDAGEIKELTPASYLLPGVTVDKLRAMKGKSQAGDECTIPAGFEGPDYVQDGLTFHDADNSCTLSWASLAGKLVKDNPVQRAVATDDSTPKESIAGWAKAPPRFVPEGDSAVRDLSTGLVWATHDNGADLDWNAAFSLALHKGDGWRLPTENELEELVDAESAHREKSDCTKGKSDLLITPAIHPSCGLLWSDEMLDGDRAVGVGFISGTPRVSKQSEKKNYRALLVKGKERR